ncbi:hypothetical protein FALBO_8411 [Fusarium albosuccineum]|uniref:Uncharacterized protein n=1 Tax=Fusarium albosuccineum TaxID=1237068 RepID=A0A8H4LAY6_9HYPO|nr:hypothetical protein FALBO_8411 [Fusarium albosuccineum]
MVDSYGTLEIDATNSLYGSSLVVPLGPPATNNNRQSSEHAKSQPRRKRQRSRPSNTPPPKRGASGCRSSSSRISSGNGSGGGDSDSDGDIGEPKNDGSKRKENTPPGHLFACHMFKQDPVKHKNCGSRRLTTWARGLQHLKRKHLIKDRHCPRCRRDSFKNEKQKDEHIRIGTCQPADIVQSGKLLKEEYNKLKNLRQSSDEESWRLAWDKLFPRFHTPSPFSESHKELISRTGVSTCLGVLRKAFPRHSGLEAVATEIIEKLTRTLTPVARQEDAVTTSAEFVQPAGSVLDQEPSNTLPQSGLLLEADPWMMMPQQIPLVPPFQVDPHAFSYEAIQSGVPPNNTTLQLPSGSLQLLPNLELGGAFSEQECILPADPQDDVQGTLALQETNAAFISDEPTFPGGFGSGHGAENDLTYMWAEGKLHLGYPDPDELD